jgi:hypothetical protein
MASEAAPAYRSLVTNKSRRLRMWGSLLVCAAALMALYGGMVLMPSLRSARDAALVQRLESQQPEAVRARRVMKTKLLFAYGYWSVCGVLVTAAMFAAWLDVRETSRSYLEHRKAIWNNVAGRDRDHDDA